MNNQPSYKLRKSRIFILLLVAGIFAVVGFSMFLTTVSWYAISEIGSPSAVGIILMTATIPRLLAMVFGGIVADKYKKTTIMFVTNFVQGLLLLVLFLLVFNNQLEFYMLLIIAGLFGVLDAFFGPTSSALIPKIVPKEFLQKANAIFQGADQISFVIGPILAGLMMEFFSIAGSFLVATILVFISAIFVFPPFIKEEDDEEKMKQTPWTDLKEGIAYVKNSRFLLVGILVLITLNFFVFGALHIAIPLLVDVFGGTPLNLSYMEASLGIGMLSGSLLLSVYTLKSHRGRTALYGLFAALLLFLLFSVTGHLGWLTVLLFFIGFSMVFVYVPFFTVAQEQTEARIMGRVMSLIFLAMNGFDPMSYGIVTGLVSFGISIQHVLFSFGLVGFMLAMVIYWRSKEFKAV
ncbi:MFS transporter [Alkalihalobacillus pseudalcaliphilus]|uniref:MFS transporter n=1 Tax=Alkalihalobacillus pseudalcaliphilus TaxID=79884 RepID=UPI00064D735F|nr:MFS transporter [Alkalihalobacillus pseudalcaliphilus]KMK78103.1 MFS transporter [Alkalihalobacillus pseudalcaliphilus]